jgi:hypothetical protein
VMWQPGKASILSLSRQINYLHQPIQPQVRPQKSPAPLAAALRSGYALPTVRPQWRFLIMIVAALSA